MNKKKKFQEKKIWKIPNNKNTNISANFYNLFINLCKILFYSIVDI